MQKKRLPDTPWHMGYALKEEWDPRRHKARCIYYNKGICQCTDSVRVGGKCCGSSHCMQYAESIYVDPYATDENSTKAKANNLPKDKLLDIKLLPGDIVVHTKWKFGKVIEVGRGAVTVDFDGMGIKKLKYPDVIQNGILKFAKHAPAESEIPRLGDLVVHETLGKGKVVAAGEGAITVSFSGIVRKFSSTDVAVGIIKLI